MIIRTKYIQGVFVAMLVVGLPYVARATAEECSRIDSSRASQFISYDGTSDSDVRLRLHNNSDCRIVIETDDHEPFVLRGEKNVALHYLLHDRRHETLKPGYGWGDSVLNVELRGGESVLFRVPLAHFNQRLDVAVPFRFAWDGDHVGAGAVTAIKHYVYFLVDEVPKNNRRRK